MSDTSIDIPNPIEDKLNEKDYNLIWTLNSVKISWSVIPYVSDGIYDKVLNNIKENKNTKLGDWYRVNHFKSDKVVLLQKPGKRVYTTCKPVINIKLNNSDIVNSYHGVVKLSLYFYLNATDKNLQGFTFGDSNNVIKPFLVFDHKWRMKEFDKNYKIYVCEDCEMIGRHKYKNDENIIIPEEFYTCEEYKVKNIL
jgi:hypothetical protein